MAADLTSTLRQLQELHRLGLLTEDELAEQKRRLLAEAFGTSAPESSPESSTALAGATRVSAPSHVHPLSGPTQVDTRLPTRLGSYRVQGVIGRGGMGTVVRARHQQAEWAHRQGGDVAIKLIHPHIANDPDFRARFLSEAALGKRAQHPGVAGVYDVITDGPWLGAVQELVEGRELTHWVRPGGLDVDRAVELLAPLADAIDHLHSVGIVHRDLKPANVKVRRDGRPVLLDLGIAKDLLGQAGVRTRTRTAMGTSAWMAPEQADARSATPAADVYAFGLIAYALLSGQMPWDAEDSELRVISTKLMGRLVPLAERVTDLPKTATDSVMAALSVELDRRPASCKALVDRLKGPEGWEVYAVGGVSFRLRHVPAGIYTVGVVGGGTPAEPHSWPQHQVQLSQAYAVGETLVTRALFEAVMGSIPDNYKNRQHSDPQLPVICSWEGAASFCNQLSKLCGLRPVYRRSHWGEIEVDEEGTGFRLPTEHEWEVAARACTDFTYAGSNAADPVAWTRGNSGGELHPVGLKAPNTWGLYDMSGNVEEWCHDNWEGPEELRMRQSRQAKTPHPELWVDPLGGGALRRPALRGGNYFLDEGIARVHRRAVGDGLTGFRLARGGRPPTGDYLVQKNMKKWFAENPS